MSCFGKSIISNYELLNAPLKIQRIHMHVHNEPLLYQLQAGEWRTLCMSHTNKPNIRRKRKNACRFQWIMVVLVKMVLEIGKAYNERWNHDNNRCNKKKPRAWLVIQQIFKSKKYKSRLFFFIHKFINRQS